MKLAIQTLEMNYQWLGEQSWSRTGEILQNWRGTAGLHEYFKKVWSKFSFHKDRNIIIIQNFLINIFIIHLTQLPLHLLLPLVIIFHFSPLLALDLLLTNFGFIFQSLASPDQVENLVWKMLALPRDTNSVPGLFRWFCRHNTGRSVQNQHRSGKINSVFLIHLSPNCTDKRRSVSFSLNFFMQGHLFWKM